ncbi:hypothetical protein HK405_006333 [Cladochytrium tenue]|nr:hypothetical protein HK405_006333 [Cladochytrium tenue]
MRTDKRPQPALPAEIVGYLLRFVEAGSGGADAELQAASCVSRVWAWAARPLVFDFVVLESATRAANLLALCSAPQALRPPLPALMQRVLLYEQVPFALLVQLANVCGAAIIDLTVTGRGSWRAHGCVAGVFGKLQALRSVSVDLSAPSPSRTNGAEVSTEVLQGGELVRQFFKALPGTVEDLTLDVEYNDVLAIGLVNDLRLDNVHSLMVTASNATVHAHPQFLDGLLQFLPNLFMLTLRGSSAPPQAYTSAFAARMDEAAAAVLARRCVRLRGLLCENLHGRPMLASPPPALFHRLTHLRIWSDDLRDLLLQSVPEDDPWWGGLRFVADFPSDAHHGPRFQGGVDRLDAKLALVERLRAVRNLDLPITVDGYAGALAAATLDVLLQRVAASCSKLEYFSSREQAWDFTAWVGGEGDDANDEDAAAVEPVERFVTAAPATLRGIELAYDARRYAERGSAYRRICERLEAAARRCGIDLAWTTPA